MNQNGCMSDAVDNAASGTGDYDGNMLTTVRFMVLLQMVLIYARNSEYVDPDDAGTRLMKRIMLLMIAAHDIF